MTVRKTYILALLFLTAGVSLQGQSLDAWLEAADTSYAQKDYYSAFKYYDAALQYDSTLARAWYYKGRSGYNFHAYRSALVAFDKVIDLDTTFTYPDVVFWLAKTYQTTGQFGKASEYYEGFLNNPGSSSELVIKEARKGLEDSKWASQLNVRTATLPPVSLGEQVNTVNSDFGGRYQDGTLYFASLNFEFEQDKVFPKRELSKLLQLDPGAEEPVLMAGPFNSEDRHTAYPAFSRDGNRLYYCKCEYITTADIRCDIYLSEKDVTGIWSEGRPLSINNPSIDNSQPSVGIDLYTGKEVLYFSSNRAGGKGGLDIWYGPILDNGDVTEQTNLTELNSPDDDVSPFYHHLSEQMFFASKGYQSYGGYDIFFSYFKDGAWVTPENIGLGVNSSFNETNYTLNDLGTKAVFDSDRPGSLYIDEDEEVCCNDLYTVNLENKLELQVLTFNALDSLPLYGVEVRLDEVDNQGKLLPKVLTWEMLSSLGWEQVDGVPLTNENSNRFDFQIDRYKLYTLEGNKELFFPDSTIVNLTGLDPKSRSVEKRLYLNPNEINLRVLTLDEDDGTDLLGCTVEIIRVAVPNDSTSISRETNETSNLFTQVLAPNYDYYIRASKPGYESRDLELTKAIIKQVGQDITVEIPLPRIDFTDFLPLALYYDNAQPFNSNYSPTTRDNYADLTERYALQQQNYYQGFASVLSEEQKFDAERYYDIFFSREVSGGMANLRLFASKLVGFLERGNSLTMQVKGYTSPIANPLYNDRLSQRRIKSIENFFSEYKEGVLKKFIDNGQLKITELALGEKRVGLDIPPQIQSFLSSLGDLGVQNIDNSKDRRLSVFSLLACIERRVEIVQVDINVKPNN